MESKWEVVEKQSRSWVMLELCGDIQNQVEYGFSYQKLKYFDNKQIDVIVFVMQILFYEWNQLLPDLSFRRLVAYLFYSWLLNRKVFAVVGLVEIYKLELEHFLCYGNVTTK